MQDAVHYMLFQTSYSRRSSAFQDPHNAKIKVDSSGVSTAVNRLPVVTPEGMLGR